MGPKKRQKKSHPTNVKPIQETPVKNPITKGGKLTIIVKDESGNVIQEAKVARSELHVNPIQRTPILSAIQSMIKTDGSGPSSAATPSNNEMMSTLVEPPHNKPGPRNNLGPTSIDCKLCKQVFHDIDQLLLHMQTCRVDESNYQDFIEPEGINKYQDYIKSVQINKFQDYIKPVETNKQKLHGVVCKLCKKVFDSKELRAHVKGCFEHEANRHKLTCQFCPKFFASKDVLEKHVRNIHKKAKTAHHELSTSKDENMRVENLDNSDVQYAGTGVGGYDQEQGSYGEGLENIRSDNFSCDKCGSLFDTEFELCEHIIIEHNDNQCQCGQAFTEQSKLTKHIKSAHSELFLCKKCQAVFVQVNEMEDHANECNLNIIGQEHTVPQSQYESSNFAIKTEPPEFERMTDEPMLEPEDAPENQEPHIDGVGDQEYAGATYDEDMYDDDSDTDHQQPEANKQYIIDEDTEIT